MIKILLLVFCVYLILMTVNGEDTISLEIPKGFRYLGSIVKKVEGSKGVKGISITSTTTTQYIVSDTSVGQYEGFGKCGDITAADAHLLSINNIGEYNAIRDFIVKAPKDIIQLGDLVWTSGVYDTGNEQWVWATDESSVDTTWFKLGDEGSYLNGIVLYVNGILPSQRYLRAIAPNTPLKFICEYII